MANRRPDVPVSADPLKASCRQCGGAVPVTLSAPAAPCPFCGAPEPFERGLSETVAKLSRKLGARSAREQQLTGKQARVGRARGAGLFLAGILPVWLLAGSILWFAIPAKGAPPFFRFLFEGRPPQEAFDPVTAKWWVLWAMATGFALTLALFGAALLAARRVVRLALPLPPASEGAPPRCRCCGASLPEAGLVRRCLYCGVDHVVMGARYQELEATLEASLASMERRMDVTLATRMRRANRALALAGTLPILVAVLAPAGLFLGGTRPHLWILTGILLAAGTALLAAGARMPVPRIRTLEEAKPGDAVFLDGSPLLVEAALDLNVNSPVEGSVLILSEGVPPKTRRALHVFRDADDRFSSSLLEIREGGKPWPEGGNTAELYPVSASAGATGPWAGAGGLLSFARFTSRDRRNWALSLWKRGTNPPPGLSPDWTLGTVEPVAEERVVFSSKEPFGGRG